MAGTAGSDTTSSPRDPRRQSLEKRRDLAQLLSRIAARSNPLQLELPGYLILSRRRYGRDP
jgi:hypothetical protein